MAKTHKIFSSRTNVESSTFIGEAGRMFYDELTGELRISDGVTPGGTPVAGGGGAGYTGSQGDPGGYTGSTGYTGYTGYVGSASTVPGYTGSQGEQGPAGGFTGSTGAGYTGSQGAIGFTGFTGYTGSRGFTGSVGSKGNTGTQGTTGFIGSQGDVGYIGSTGTQGTTGFVGSKGFVGSIGFVGSQGTTGFVGSQGDVGYIGSTGTQGTTGFIGSQGTQGTTGFIGSQGSTGFVGSSGATGFIGSQGSTGYIGSQGSTGFAGSIGFTGSTGTQGTTGFIGSQGSTGFAGSTGSQGDVGYIGSQGDVGYIGSQGNSGNSGNTGYIGSQGDIGFVGSQGDIGGLGYVGSQGIIGEIGYVGSQGIPGDQYHTVSTSTLTMPASGNFSITIEPGLAYSIEQTIIVHPTANLTNHIDATVVSYNIITGILVATVNNVIGAGSTYSDWVVNLSGAVGAIGFVGSQGSTGFSGSQGYFGSQGATGFIGSQGTTGFIGSQGVIGFTGSTGTQGATGFIGSKGTTGFTGSQGIGYVGSQGLISGTTGQLLFNNAGVATGTTNLLFDGTNLTVQGPSSFNSTATVYSDMHITQNLTVDGKINFVGTATVVQGTSGQFFGDVIGNGALYAGVASYTAFPQTMFQATGDYNGFMEINVQNVNPGVQNTTDIVATADNGTLSTAYIDMGITGSAWDGSQPNTLGTALQVNDGYIFVSGPATGVGDLVLGTNTTSTQIKIVVAGADNSALVAVFNPVNTVSTSTNTGAFIVTGGVGIQGNVNLPLGAKITVGVDVLAAALPNVPAQFSGNTNNYFQINSQNVNSGTLASTDIVLTADNGSDTNYYIDLGIASSNAATPLQERIKPNDGYLYVQGNDLIIGTASSGKKIEFFTSGLSTSTSTYHAMTLADNTVTIYSSLVVNGSIYQNGSAIGNTVTTRTVTSSTNLLDTDRFIFALNTLTLQLPDATINNGKGISIKNIDGGAITVITTSTQTIDGYTNMTITEYNSVMSVMSNGSNWFIY